MREQTKPFLRVDQVEEMEGDRQGMESQLKNPIFKGDRGVVAQQLRRLNDQLESQRPKAYSSDEIDAAVRREAELRAEIKIGMPSHEEMRKAPPGAVDRHREWEKKNFAKIEEWQNIQRRLTAGSDDREAASVERFRPTVNTLNMDNAQIPGKLIFLPAAGTGKAVVFTEDQLTLLRQLSPEIAEKMGSLSNAPRQQVKETLTGEVAQPTKKIWKNMNAAERKAYRSAKKAA